MHFDVTDAVFDNCVDQHAQHSFSRYAANCIKAIDPETEKYQNPDHTAVGKAAKAVKDSERASDAVFYYEFIHLPEEKDTRRFIYIEPTKEEKEKIKKAADSYRFWAPERGRYAVGYHSVADEFNDFLLHTLAAVLRK